ncbi:ribosome biogenesis protein Nop53/GLTSCR2 [Lentinula raphanica]|uniref:Ribosome biogenesis protein NOP53 n=1 Tax=Lentinula raphanica TaxID=153919 RepID=A0AA38PJE6_9AGAR|nr:ribosome biogenesis protein Nop53/GLTSCR2 [Lentinula raphanica]KAJ3843715.1 ribosome biogenesis protein Nop53/GLTSCR2 [Lentinula raphanica]KAJ3974157.1 ribosome biogenesis protein Nop53/GLTSCR2 [Lentinula raphanica]
MSKSGINTKKSLQPSRKGKKAWRKNVDLKDLEESLEERRVEERLFGGALSEKPDSALFVVDTEGDENLRSVLPKPKIPQLTSLKILSERSAVPAVYSRTTSAPTRKHGLSQQEKDRLLRIAKRPRKGPFGAIVDERDSWSKGAAAAGGVSEAVKSSGQYDPWALPPSSSSETAPLPIANLPPTHAPKPTTSTITINPRSLISLPAVPLPHAGASYNPPVEAHTELLHRAHNEEEVRLREETRWKDASQAIKDAVTSAPSIGAEGMSYDDIQETNVDQGEVVEEILPPKKMPQRKTKADRRKAAKLIAEKRALAERAAKRRQLSYLNELNARRLKRAGYLPAPRELVQRRRKALQEKLKSGIVGQKLGKYRVPATPIDVQLGDELSESLRAMKVEGNLFKDRFLNLQQRALIEPRLRVLPKKRRVRIVEYEKHAWKKFDREQESLSK